MTPLDTHARTPAQASLDQSPMLGGPWAYTILYKGIRILDFGTGLIRIEVMAATEFTFC
jgi:hypothetical protein